MVISKEELVFKRGEDGKLLALETALETLPNKPIVRIRPLTRGKLQEIFSKANSESAEEKRKADTELLKVGLVEPELTDEDLVNIKPQWAAAVVTAILAASLGISQKEVGKKTEEFVQEQEDILSKK